MPAQGLWNGQVALPPPNLDAVVPVRLRLLPVGVLDRDDRRAPSEKDAEEPAVRGVAGQLRHTRRHDAKGREAGFQGSHGEAWYPGGAEIGRTRRWFPEA